MLVNKFDESLWFLVRDGFVAVAVRSLGGGARPA